jgi:RND family efflux transporter MFP subunit
VLVREGAAVSKGQVLARFRTVSLEPEAASAEAELVMRAADRERMRNLLAEGAVAERDVESAEAAWRAAQAGRAQAQRRLADATVRAPVAGVIAERSVHSGDRVGDGDPMFRLVNTRELEFEATVPAEHAGAIARGAPVSLLVSGRPVVIEGRVARVNAAADPATRQIQVYVVVANPTGALVGGVFASGSIVTREAKAALAAPIAAVRTAGDTTYVLLVENGALARRPVVVGLRDEARDRIEIASGVQEGDQVIVGPIEGLEVGRPVILGADAPAAARAAPKPAAGGGH